MNCRNLVWAIGFAAVVSGCTPAIAVKDSLRPALATDSAHHVLMLRSSSNPQFDDPIASFLAAYPGTVSVYDLERNSDGSLQAELQKVKPNLIVTLGSKATLLCKEICRDMPVVFAMVVNHERLELGQLDNFAGVAIEQAPLAEFSQFKMVHPTLSKVLVIYNKAASEALVRKAASAVKSLGIELVLESVDESAFVGDAYDKHKGRIDAVWLLSDQIVMNAKTFDLLKQRTNADKHALLASFSDEFVKAGALMAVSSDSSTIGSQVAAITRLVLEQQQTPKSVGVQAPVGSRLAVNLDTASAIDLQIPADVLPFIHTVFRSSAASRAAR